MLEYLRSIVPNHYRAALLRNRLTSRIIRSFVRRRQLKQHPHCRCKLVFDGQRNLGWATGGLRHWERDYFAACSRILNTIKPNVVWDVGANVGIWSLFFATEFESVSQVVVFEPDTVNERLLRENIALNDLLSRIVVRPVALSATSGEAEFQADPLTGSTGSLEKSEGFITRYYGEKTQLTTVKISTIDEEIAAGLPVPQFLKIDVEGHECEVFRGAERMLSESRPLMIVEFSGVRSSDAFDILTKFDYRFLRPSTGEACDAVEFELVCAPSESVNTIRAAFKRSRA